MRTLATLWILLLGLRLAGAASPAEPVPPSPSPPRPPIPARSPSADTTTNLPPMREIQPGLFELGQVRLDQSNRTVTLPAVVNLRESPVEYLLVTDYGKIHEAILRTAVPPYQIHVAMLLLNAKGAGTNALPEDPKSAMPGDAVTIEVRWPPGSAKGGVSAESLVFNRRLKKPMPSRTWRYTGSTLYEGTLLAQQEGSIISLITDPAALINYPGPGREDDEAWLPHAKTLPAEETRVDVILRLEKNPAKP